MGVTQHCRHLVAIPCTLAVSTCAMSEKVSLFGEASDEESPEVSIPDALPEWQTARIIQLQSQFAHDPRFKIDARFVESEPERGRWSGESVGLIVGLDGGRSDSEKRNNLRILGRVLGGEVGASPSAGPSLLTARFDPRKEDSRLYQVRPDQTPEHVAPVPEAPVPAQSTHVRFYEVSSELRESLLERAEFSLGCPLPGEPEDTRGRNEASVEQSLPAAKFRTDNPFRYDSSESEAECEAGPAVASLVSGQRRFPPFARFFFAHNDARFGEDSFWPQHTDSPSGVQLVRALSLRRRSAQKNARSATKFARKKRARLASKRLARPSA